MPCGQTAHRYLKSVFVQGKSPSDTHIKQVCMRVMQGKCLSSSDHTQLLFYTVLLNCLTLEHFVEGEFKLISWNKLMYNIYIVILSERVENYSMFKGGRQCMLRLFVTDTKQVS